MHANATALPLSAPPVAAHRLLRGRVGVQPPELLLVQERVAARRRDDDDHVQCVWVRRRLRAGGRRWVLRRRRMRRQACGVGVQRGRRVGVHRRLHRLLRSGAREVAHHIVAHVVPEVWRVELQRDGAALQRRLGCAGLQALAGRRRRSVRAGGRARRGEGCRPSRGRRGVRGAAVAGLQRRVRADRASVASASGAGLGVGLSSRLGGLGGGGGGGDAAPGPGRGSVREVSSFLLRMWLQLWPRRSRAERVCTSAAVGFSGHV